MTKNHLSFLMNKKLKEIMEGGVAKVSRENRTVTTLS